MKISKGDKVKQIKEVKGFNFVGHTFIITRIDEANRVVHIRFTGKVKDLFPDVSNRFVKSPEVQNLEFAVSKNLFKFDDIFKRVLTWTDWREMDVLDKRFENIALDEENPPMYKTNRRYVIFKANGIKAKSTCNAQDTFDLSFGLNLAIERWQEKLYKTTDSEDAKTQQNVNFIDRTCDIFDMPFYYYVAHCITTEHSIVTDMDKKFDGLCNLKESFNEMTDNGFPYKIGEVFWKGNIFGLVTNKPYQKMTMENLTSCVYEMAATCVSEKVSYLAIPHFGGRKHNLKWDEVKDMVIKEFEKVYNDPIENPENLKIQIVACDAVVQVQNSLKIQTVDTPFNSIKNTTEPFNIRNESNKSNYKNNLDTNFWKF